MIAEKNQMSGTRTVLNAGAIGLMGWRFLPPLMPIPHRHSDIELNFLIHGSSTYLHRERFVTIRAGQLLLFWGAIPHQLIERTDSCDMCVLTVPLELFVSWKLPVKLTQPLLAGELLVEQQEAEGHIDAALFPRWIADVELGRGFITLKEVEARLWRFALATNSTLGQTKTGQGHSKENQMARFIVDHYSEALTIQQIADAVNLHPNYAMSCFKATFGMTVLEYILQYRVAQAQRLLATTEEGILEIALQSGFGSSSNFYAAFKKYVGCSPSVYRKSVL